MLNIPQTSIVIGSQSQVGAGDAIQFSVRLHEVL